HCTAGQAGFESRWGMSARSSASRDGEPLASAKTKADAWVAMVQEKGSRYGHGFLWLRADRFEMELHLIFDVESDAADAARLMEKGASKALASLPASLQYIGKTVHGPRHGREVVVAA